NIPVCHGDPHGSAICVAAALYNALRIVGKNITEVRLTACGAGAAALACLNLLVSMDLPREHITVCDIHGVVYTGRTVEMDPYKSEFAVDTNKRTLGEALVEAVIFLGCSGPGALKPEKVEMMSEQPIFLPLSNPSP